MRRRKEKCLSHIFTIAASSFIRNIPRFLHEITTLNHNAFDHSGAFRTCRQRGTRESVRRKIQTALEANDSATLQSVLYMTGADPMIVGFYKMMQSGGAGDKVSKIELVDLTPDGVKKATAPQDSPNGGKVCLKLKPTKKLVIVIEKKDENGGSTNTTENFIAEKDGKFVIPVPGPCK